MSMRVVFSGVLGAALSVMAFQAAAETPPTGYFSGVYQCGAKPRLSQWLLRPTPDGGVAASVYRREADSTIFAPASEATHNGPLQTLDAPLPEGWTHVVLIEGGSKRFSLRKIGDDPASFRVAWQDAQRDGSLRPDPDCQPFTITAGPPPIAIYDAFLAAAEAEDPARAEAQALIEMARRLPPRQMLPLLDQESYAQRRNAAHAEFWRRRHKALNDRLDEARLGGPEEIAVYRALLEEALDPGLSPDGQSSALPPYDHRRFQEAMDRLHDAGGLEPRIVVAADPAFCRAADAARSGDFAELERHLRAPLEYWDRPFVERMLEAAQSCPDGERFIRAVAQRYVAIQTRQERVGRLRAEAAAMIAAGQAPDGKPLTARTLRPEDEQGLSQADLRRFFFRPIEDENRRREAALDASIRPRIEEAFRAPDGTARAEAICKAIAEAEGEEARIRCQAVAAPFLERIQAGRVETLRGAVPALAEELIAAGAPKLADLKTVRDYLRDEALSPEDTGVAFLGGALKARFGALSGADREAVREAREPYMDRIRPILAAVEAEAVARIEKLAAGEGAEDAERARLCGEARLSAAELAWSDRNAREQGSRSAYDRACDALRRKDVELRLCAPRAREAGVTGDLLKAKLRVEIPREGAAPVAYELPLAEFVCVAHEDELRFRFEKAGWFSGEERGFSALFQREDEAKGHPMFSGAIHAVKGEKDVWRAEADKTLPQGHEARMREVFRMFPSSEEKMKQEIAAVWEKISSVSPQLAFACTLAEIREHAFEEAERDRLWQACRQ